MKKYLNGSEWVLAPLLFCCCVVIRNRKDGKPVLLMPSNECTPLPDEDMGALMAYLKSLLPMDRELPQHSLRPLDRILTALDKGIMIAAEQIDHSAKNDATVKPEISTGLWQYVAVSCVGCHRENYKGGEAIVPGSWLDPILLVRAKLANGPRLSLLPPWVPA